MTPSNRSVVRVLPAPDEPDAAASGEVGGAAPSDDAEMLAQRVEVSR